MEYTMILSFLLKEERDILKRPSTFYWDVETDSHISNPLLEIKAPKFQVNLNKAMSLNSSNSEQKEGKYYSKSVIQSLEKEFPRRLMPEYIVRTEQDFHNILPGDA